MAGNISNNLGLMVLAIGMSVPMAYYTFQPLLQQQAEEMRAEQSGGGAKAAAAVPKPMAPEDELIASRTKGAPNAGNITSPVMGEASVEAPRTLTGEASLGAPRMMEGAETAMVRGWADLDRRAR